MQTRLRSIGCLIAFACALSGCVSQAGTDANHANVAAAGLNRAPVEMPVKMTGVDGFSQAVFKTGPVFIAGQPTEAALERMVNEDGVKLVVNVRTPQEMNDRQRVPFDEEATMKRLGVEYVFLPLGGQDNAFPYTPDTIDRFAEALARHEDGKVLLHCQVGWRVSHVWTAYLIRYRGMTPDEALKYGKAMLVTDLPFEGLAGLKATYSPS